jgi:hypothetical protein
MLGDDLTKEVLEAMNSRIIPKGWNEMMIVLILIFNDPERIAQYKPISLCNVVYKVISKIYTNSLKVILPDIIL